MGKINYKPNRTLGDTPSPEILSGSFKLPPKNDDKQLVGIVSTAALNVRSSPEITSENSLGYITKGTEVLIDNEMSTDEFYKILTKAGDDGYCMKKFVRIRSDRNGRFYS